MSETDYVRIVLLQEPCCVPGECECCDAAVGCGQNDWHPEKQ